MPRLMTAAIHVAVDPNVPCVRKRAASVCGGGVSTRVEIAGGVNGATKVCEPMPGVNVPRSSPLGNLAESRPMVRLPVFSALIRSTVEYAPVGVKVHERLATCPNGRLSTKSEPIFRCAPL